MDAEAEQDLGFEGADPEATGRPAYHPATLLKLYIYGYLNRIQSSRRSGCGTLKQPLNVNGAFHVSERGAAS